MIARHVFRDRLSGLPAPERPAFLANLWAARGWETTVQDGTVVAVRTDPTDERITLEVIDDDTPVSAGSDGPARSAGGTFRVRARTGDPNGSRQVLRTLDADDLYDLLRYGIDRERRSELLQTLPTDGHRSRPHRRGPPPDVKPGRSPGSWTRSVVPLAVVGLMLVGALLAGATAEGVAAPFAADQVDGRLRYVLQCGDHPVAVAPGTLHPKFTASGPPDPASWEVVPDPLAASEDRFRGSPVSTPESRAVATYAGPDDHRYRVEVARWRTDWLAANAADRAIESTVRVTWVWWSFDVQVLTSAGEGVRNPAVTATSLSLLGAIELPPDVSLDPTCPAQITGL